MVEKKFTDYLRINVAPSDASYGEVDDGLTAYFDESLLQKYLPPTSGAISADSVLASSLERVLPPETIEALKDTEFVGVYARVVSDDRRNIKCLQYIFLWDYQAVPEHESDYEPVFVFITPGGEYAVYDLIHYCSRRLDIDPSNDSGPGLRVIPGWHSFLPTANLPKDERDKGLNVKPLTDQHLHSWWSIPEDEPRLKIEKFLRDPFLLEAPGHFMEHPDEESKTMCCAFLEIEKAMQEYESPKDGVVEGVRRALAKCVGLFGIFKLGAFVRMLSEMNDVGLIQLPVSLRSGIDFGAIGELLRGGAVSLTKAGSRFFEGYKSADSE